MTSLILTEPIDRLEKLHKANYKKSVSHNIYDVTKRTLMWNNVLIIYKYSTVFNNIIWIWR
jgi:hypothetical protein